MRITRGLLLKNAKNAAAEQVYRNRKMVCIYLTGSLLLEEPLLGGATDIDLICVHDEDPPIQREIIRITDEIHLDVAHFSQEEFNDTRQLRINPWMGSYLCQDPVVLHASGHWFEFVQASACTQFMEPEYRLQRAQPLIESARQGWFDLQGGSYEQTPSQVLLYFEVLENAANAIAVLTGSPLTERRFILNYPSCAEEIERPGLAEGLNDLFTLEDYQENDWQDWLKAWEAAFLEAGTKSQAEASLHPHRLHYYRNAMKALHEDHPAAARWLLLRTWTLTLCHLPADTASLPVWQQACSANGLHRDYAETRLKEMDTYLDNVEETLDLWAEDYGLTPLTERI